MKMPYVRKIPGMNGRCLLACPEHLFLYQRSPLQQESEAPSNNATSRFTQRFREQ